MNKNIKHIQVIFNEFLDNCKQEQEDYKKVNILIHKYINNRKSLTHWEYEYIRLKFQDYAKIATSGIIIALPAGSIILPFLLKYSKKVGIDLRPSSFKK